MADIGEYWPASHVLPIGDEVSDLKIAWSVEIPPSSGAPASQNCRPTPDRRSKPELLLPNLSASLIIIYMELKGSKRIRCTHSSLQGFWPIRHLAWNLWAVVQFSRWLKTTGLNGLLNWWFVRHRGRCRSWRLQQSSACLV